MTVALPGWIIFHLFSARLTNKIPFVWLCYVFLMTRADMAKVVFNLCRTTESNGLLLSGHVTWGSIVHWLPSREYLLIWETGLVEKAKQSFKFLLIHFRGFFPHDYLHGEAPPSALRKDFFKQGT